MSWLPWIAVIILPLSYWLQVYRIWKHKEVRDLSLPSYIMMAIGFVALGYEAWDKDSSVFMAKQALVLVPVLMTIFLIITHRKSEWHDDDDLMCECGNELEPHWKHCADCGKVITLSLQEISNERTSDFSDERNVYGRMCNYERRSRKCGRC